MIRMHIHLVLATSAAVHHVLLQMVVVHDDTNTDTDSDTDAEQ